MDPDDSSTATFIFVVSCSAVILDRCVNGQNLRLFRKPNRDNQTMVKGYTLNFTCSKNTFLADYFEHLQIMIALKPLGAFYWK